MTHTSKAYKEMEKTLKMVNPLFTVSSKYYNLSSDVNAVLKIQGNFLL